MSTTVRFIGSGDAFGSGGRLQTCILIEDRSWRCLLDCGTTSLVGINAAGIDPATIDAILITHLHGDHFGGLPFWLLDAQLNHRRTTPLLLAGPADLESRLRAAMEVLFPGSQRALDVVDVEFVELTPGPAIAIGAATVAAFDVDHFCGSPPFALRLRTPSGSTVAYSGDTAWTDELLVAADHADLFIAEAYFYEKSIKWHLDYATLMRHLPRLTARRTVITHLGRDMLDRLDDAELTAAHDGLILEIQRLGPASPGGSGRRRAAGEDPDQPGPTLLAPTTTAEARQRRPSGARGDQRRADHDADPSDQQRRARHRELGVDEHTDEELSSDGDAQGGGDTDSSGGEAQGGNDDPSSSPERSPPPAPADLEDLAPRGGRRHPRATDDDAGELERERDREGVGGRGGSAEHGDLHGDADADTDGDDESTSHDTTPCRAESGDRLDPGPLPRRPARPVRSGYRAAATVLWPDVAFSLG